MIWIAVVVLVVLAIVFGDFMLAMSDPGWETTDRE